jgi:hypothetical protein
VNKFQAMRSCSKLDIPRSASVNTCAQTCARSFLVDWMIHTAHSDAIATWRSCCSCDKARAAMEFAETVSTVLVAVMLLGAMLLCSVLSCGLFIHTVHRLGSFSFLAIWRWSRGDAELPLHRRLMAAAASLVLRLLCPADDTMRVFSFVLRLLSPRGAVFAGCNVTALWSNATTSAGSTAATFRGA